MTLTRGEYLLSCFLGTSILVSTFYQWQYLTTHLITILTLHFVCLYLHPFSSPVFKELCRYLLFLRDLFLVTFKLYRFCTKYVALLQFKGSKYHDSVWRTTTFSQSLFLRSVSFGNPLDTEFFSSLYFFNTTLFVLRLMEYIFNLMFVLLS